jgi:membrane-bound lytic murein transglycosylase B
MPKNAPPVPGTRRNEKAVCGILLALLAAVTFLATQLSPFASAAKKPPFQVWLAELRKEALAEGIRQTTLDQALAGLAPLPRVIKLDRSQPEFTLTLEEYLHHVVPETVVEEGQEKLAEHDEILKDISRRYGVQPRFIVAFWGIETKFGRLTGGFPVIASLATLAYDGRRNAFFRRELFHALHILDEGHIPVEEMTGSWAGAMGQVQFMPSSFRNFAVDYDGDGRIDIWNNRGDAFASAANYLSRSGWLSEQTWGQEARLPKGFDAKLIGLQTRKPLSEWQSRGVRDANGRDLTTAPDFKASLLKPDGKAGPAFLVYDNYRVILKWNRSDLFAIAVGTLADRIDRKP